MAAKTRGGTSTVRGSDIDAGVHLDTDAGPVDVGLAVSDTAVAVLIDAPGLGRLHAAFDVNAEGAARLTALSRKSLAAEPFVAPIFVMDQARVDELRSRLSAAQRAQSASAQSLQAQLAEVTTARDELQKKLERLQGELDAKTVARDALEEKLSALGSELGAMTTAHDALEEKVDTLEGELAAERAKFADTSARLSTVEGELPGATEALGAMTAERDAQLAAVKALEAERTTLTAELAEAKRTEEGLRPRLEHSEQLALKLSEQVTVERRKGTELTARRFDTEEALAKMTEERDAQFARAQALEAEHDVTVQSLRQTEVERDGATNHASSLETSSAQLTDELARVNAQLALSGQEAARVFDEVRTRLMEVEQTLASEQTKSAGLEAELAKEKEELANRQVTLEEEQALRDEMVRDLAFIQSQVSDLSTTKGALVSRIDSMSKREVKRQKSSAEISDLLRDAEVVAADKQTTARRMQAHAGRLEEQLVELNRQNEGLQARLVEAETAHAQLVEVTAERDRLKVDIVFFQKQLGAMQRAANPRPSAGGPAVTVPVSMAALQGALVATDVSPSPRGGEGSPTQAPLPPAIAPVAAPAASPARPNAPIAAPAAPPATVSPGLAMPDEWAAPASPPLPAPEAAPDEWAELFPLDPDEK